MKWPRAMDWKWAKKTVLMAAPPAGESLPDGKPRPDEYSLLLQVLTSAGFEVKVVTPSLMPADLPTLAQYNSVVLVDVPARGAAFVSRGDDSGTNIRELDIWDDAGLNPKGKGWYFEAGAKMGDTLIVADQKKAYTLSDMGTFLNYEKKVQLKVLFRGDPALRNNYSVIALNPDRFPKAKYREAMDFIAFVTSPEGQKLIAQYAKHGVNLFYPDAVPTVMANMRK